MVAQRSTARPPGNSATLQFRSGLLNWLIHESKPERNCKVALLPGGLAVKVKQGKSDIAAITGDLARGNSVLHAFCKSLNFRQTYLTTLYTAPPPNSPAPTYVFFIIVLFKVD